ncbi:MAG TPA: hypothetical protein VGR78_11920 [Verrucomicrobiae bacterium]|jgi:hypothetical protein|nr:hypothetical protein [Verrucomicrobiae bacterium]
MTTLRRKAALTFLTLTLFGCAEPEPPKATTTVTTIQTTRVVSLKIGMKGSDAIAQAGIPCDPSTIRAIDAGGNVTLNYQGRSYVFSKGVLEAVR